MLNRELEMQKSIEAYAAPGFWQKLWGRTP